jgi:hypothetical protein
MGSKRSTIHSRVPRWRPGKYRARGRSRRPRPPAPFRPIRDTLIAVGVSLTAALVVFCVAVPLATTYRIPLYVAFGGVMLPLSALTFRMAAKDPTGRLMAVIMALVCLLGSAALYTGRDKISLNPHRHTISGDGGSVGSNG